MSDLLSDFIVDDISEKIFPMLDDLYKEHDWELTSADYVDAIIDKGVTEYFAYRVYGAWLFDKGYVRKPKEV